MPPVEFVAQNLEMIVAGGMKQAHIMFRAGDDQLILVADLKCGLPVAGNTDIFACCALADAKTDG